MADAPHYLRQELEELFQSRPSMWRFVQEGSLDGVWYWDLTQPDQEWMSPEFWRLFGIDPATKAHSPDAWQEIINPDDLAVALKNFELHCQDPAHPYDQIVRYRHADGSTVWVRCRGIAIRDETGKPIRMLGAHNDLTAIKRAEASAIAARGRAEAANQELSSFAYSISHDLKSPANTTAMILDEVMVSAKGTLAAPELDLLARAQDTVGRMRSLIENLLDYTRLVGEAPAMERVGLDATVANAIADLAAPIAEAQTEVTVGPLPEVRGKPSQLHQLFQNLLGNAVKYRDPARRNRVTVQAKTSGDSVDVSVEDNGIGIAAHHQDRIFDLFQRLHRHDEVSGTGLGLALCRRVAMNHGGSIRLDSRPEVGSTFTVTLPRAAGP